MPAPASASRHYRRLPRLQAITLAALRHAWRKMEPTGAPWPQQITSSVGPDMLAILLAAQSTALEEADAYQASVLTELGIATGVASLVDPTGFLGFAGDGR